MGSSLSHKKVLVIYLAPTGSTVYNLITHKYLTVESAFPFSRSVCKSQNRKIIRIQSPSEGGRQMSFDNGLRWSLLATGGLHFQGTLSKTAKTGLRVFCDLQTFIVYWFIYPYFH